MTESPLTAGSVGTHLSARAHGHKLQPRQGAFACHLYLVSPGLVWTGKDHTDMCVQIGLQMLHGFFKRSKLRAQCPPDLTPCSTLMPPDPLFM